MNYEEALVAVDVPFNLTDYLTNNPNISEQRQRNLENLTKLDWFQATEPRLQQELVALPANHEGFLTDMVARPVVIGGALVTSLADLARGNFALIPKFNVQRDGNEYTYEYVSWRHGPRSGSKGILFIRPSADEEPTEFIVLVGEKFAPGKKVFDCIGGFVEVETEGINQASATALKEAREETGVKDLRIDSVLSLGVLLVDAGLTNNRPALFAAFITNEEAGRIEEKPVNTDVTELDAGVLRVPMSQLREFVLHNDDAMFLSAVVRAIALGTISADWLTPKK